MAQEKEYPDYKEEIEEQYPECFDTAQHRHGANWFRVTIHLPALAEKDKQIASLKAELEEGRGAAEKVYERISF